MVIHIPDPADGSGDVVLKDFAKSLLGDSESSSQSKRRYRFDGSGKPFESDDPVKAGQKSMNRLQEAGGDVLDADLGGRYPEAGPAQTTGSMSLVGQSTINHQRQCSCGQLSPIWYARCGACGAYFSDRGR